MLFPIAPQPGIFRQGTEYEAGGAFGQFGSSAPRWWDSSLTRFYGAMVGPIGGFRTRSANAVTGSARAILPWSTNAGVRWIAVGTHSGLFVQSVQGAVTDITPSMFVAGMADQSVNVGFGGGDYGAGAYGTPRSDVNSVIDALVWDIDTWGEQFTGCAFSDGRLVSWDLDITHKATAITGAPTGCLGTFVAEQGFQFAVCPGGSGRTLEWSDQGDNTDWTPSTTNQAGQIDLVTAGKIQKGLRFGPLAFVLTTTEAHVGQYVGLPSIWNFQRVGEGCGAISKGCIVGAGLRVVWWGGSGFWLYDGSVQPLPCDVWDLLRQNLNAGQNSKVTGFHNAANGEVWWFYPSAGSLENDSYVYWDYRQNLWGIGSLARLCAAEVGVFDFPLAVDSSGLIYEHEVGWAYGGAIPFIELGPIELGNGDQVMNCFSVIPDEGTAGQVTLDFRLKSYPNGAETILGETVLDGSGQADLRFSARQAKMRITAVAAAPWRFGKCRLELRPGGKR